MRLIYQQITTKNILYPKCVKLRREFLWQPYRIVTSNHFDKEEDESVIFIARRNKNIVGCVLLTPELQYHWQHIRQLVVHPTYRQQGIGTELLLQAESYAKQIEYNQTALYSFKENLSFFEKRGYKTATGWFTHTNKMKTILMIHQL